ncbi:MAG: nucleoside hydrolase [Chitinivibrionales bacterium]|nr:nucleoside hydrolase [Chitinivibrionales bacterium]MBD3395874.1 nucleoside hydrolase [Chitinivibrionales bacterium]
MRKKVLLDTDIGSDIDDAVCLAYLLAHPACELVGITTVSGEPVKRAMMASALCKAAGRKVPICPGAENPMRGPQQQPRASQAGKLDRWSHDESFPAENATEFLGRALREHPGEIHLLAIGPMTNLGLLLSEDPEAASLLASLTMMIGRFVTPDTGYGPEWNARCDPHAAAIVYQAPVKQHRSVGLDVTLRVTRDAGSVREEFTAPLLQPVLDFSEVWFENMDTMVFHDPLAATTLFHDDICTFSRGTVNVLTDAPETAGTTVWTAGDTGSPHEVATSVATERFFSEYFAPFAVKE